MNNLEENYHMGTEVNLRIMWCVDDTCSSQDKSSVIIDMLPWFYRAHIILVLGVIAALSLSISTFHSLLDETPLDMLAGGVIGLRAFLTKPEIVKSLLHHLLSLIRELMVQKP